jgi:hypothetical protein
MLGVASRLLSTLLKPGSVLGYSRLTLKPLQIGAAARFGWRDCPRFELASARVPVRSPRDDKHGSAALFEHHALVFGPILMSSPTCYEDLPKQ